ncbi:hypothetical protein D3C71_1248540 [compost metagenome]
MPAQRGGTAGLREPTGARVAPGQAGEGLDTDVLRHGQRVAQFAEQLGGAGAVVGSELLGHAGNAGVAFGGDVVPGVGRTGHQVQLAGADIEYLAAKQCRAVAANVRLGRTVVHLNVAVGEAQRTAQAPAAAQGMVYAGEDAACLLAHLRGIAVAFHGLPIADDFGPGGLRVRGWQGRGGRGAAGLRGGGARPHARAQIGAQVGQGNGAHRVVKARQAGRHAGVRFAGQAVEGVRRRALGQRQDVVVQRVAGGQAVQGVGHGALVAALRRVCEGDGTGRRFRRSGRSGRSGRFRGARVHGHLLAAKLHHDVLGVVVQGRVQEGVVGRYAVELPIDRARAKNGVFALGLEPVVWADMDGRPRQIRRAADHYAAACRRLRIGRHLVDGARRERQVTRHVQGTADLARRQGSPALQRGCANLAHAVQ